MYLQYVARWFHGFCREAGSGSDFYRRMKEHGKNFFGVLPQCFHELVPGLIIHWRCEVRGLLGPFYLLVRSHVKTILRIA